jgi:hypothetical protein
MVKHHLKLPLRIREVAEAFAVEDTLGRTVSITYYERANGQLNLPRRSTKEVAREIAQTIARASTKRMEDEDRGWWADW